MAARNPFSSRSKLKVAGKTYTYFALQALEDQGLAELAKLPFSIRILLEQALRNLDDYVVTEDHVRSIAGWGPQ
ncbi:MAG: hypothetical protein KAI24_14075, partial [Planctomycetes bacterium]|nr:hypothetical protein [Planctomycetota bacterium]